MNTKVILKVVGIDFAIQFGAWSLAAALKTEKFYDLTGSLTFITLGGYSFFQNEKMKPRQKILTGMLTLWASRLGSFLLRRILRDKTDRRFNGVRDKPMKFLFFWTVQAVWILLSGLPVYVVNSVQRDPPWQWSDYLGWVLWTTGFLFEIVADTQKWNFHNNPNNAEKFITGGLWKFSRHPNYFGEILISFGQYFSAFASMAGWESIFTFLSPLFVTFLLTRVSGIPLLEKSADKKWGGNLQYQDYKRRTSVLIPMPPRS